MLDTSKAKFADSGKVSDEEFKAAGYSVIREFPPEFFFTKCPSCTQTRRKLIYYTPRENMYVVCDCGLIGPSGSSAEEAVLNWFLRTYEIRMRYRLKKMIRKALDLLPE